MGWWAGGAAPAWVRVHHLGAKRTLECSVLGMLRSYRHLCCCLYCTALPPVPLRTAPVLQIIDLMVLVVDAAKGIQAQTAECLVIGEVAVAAEGGLVVALNKIGE